MCAASPPTLMSWYKKASFKLMRDILNDGLKCLLSPLKDLQINLKCFYLREDFWILQKAISLRGH